MIHCSLFTASLFADVYLLKDGGKIEGELLNPNEVPRKTYRIKTADGAEITIPAVQIDRHRKSEREALREYNAFAPFEENTIENHLRIADWCSKNQLPDLSKQHLKQILELDRDNKDARRMLGYVKQEDGSWTTTDDIRSSRGLLKHEGRWKTQQQIDVESKFARQKKKELEWEKRIGTMSKNDLSAITDPAAAVPLWKALTNASNPDGRILLIRALGNITTPAALHSVARWALNPKENEEVRQTCYEVILKYPEAKQAIIGFYATYLNPNTDPATLNLAARGIAELDGKSAVPQLIDVLITYYTKQTTVGSDTPSVVQGNSGGLGMSAGTKTVKQTFTSQNRDVLNALIRLTGNNFQFNQDTWRNWLIQSQKTASFNARRSEL
ncbi:MAG: hypothetical protein LBN39_09320 [Planctomycetaceae bacterium]|jgi:HEAT repeat protein|nr:hypothetical protein [Planctomycetaceae bacterium]